jgi:hypothetical protein
MDGGGWWGDNGCQRACRCVRVPDNVQIDRHKRGKNIHGVTEEAYS